MVDAHDNETYTAQDSRLIWIDCEMTGCDLAFERSEVEADILTPVISVKNPLSGHIRLPEVGEVIRDIDGADGRVKIRKNPTRQICA